MKITACMMVKNEEANLDRCLKSIKDCVHEIRYNSSKDYVFCTKCGERWEKTEGHEADSVTTWTGTPCCYNPTQHY